MTFVATSVVLVSWACQLGNVCSNPLKFEVDVKRMDLPDECSVILINCKNMTKPHECCPDRFPRFPQDIDCAELHEEPHLCQQLPADSIFQDCCDGEPQPDVIKPRTKLQVVNTPSPFADQNAAVQSKAEPQSDVIKPRTKLDVINTPSPFADQVAAVQPEAEPATNAFRGGKYGNRGSIRGYRF